MKQAIDKNEMMDAFFVDKGMLHLAYRVHSKDDLISPYSVPQYEVLNEEFVAYMEKMIPFLPGHLPVLLEITGCTFSQEEQKCIESAVDSHFSMRFAIKQKACRNSLIRTAWLLISFIASSYLLFCTDADTNNVVVQYAFLPFWFFGYRVLTGVVLDYVPLLRERRQYAQLSEMKLLFTKKPVDTVAPEKSDQILQKAADALEAATKAPAEFEKEYLRKHINDQKVINHYLMENGTVYLQCRLKNMDEVIRSSSIEGYELLNDSFAAYIENFIPYLPEKAPVVLEILSDTLREEEKKIVEQSIYRHFTLGQLNAENETRKGMYQIQIFCACLAVSSVLLFFGENTNKAVHEFLTMMFWFFGDYLIEYILLDQGEIVADRNAQAQMREMKICFKENPVQKA